MILPKVYLEWQSEILRCAKYDSEQAQDGSEGRRMTTWKYFFAACEAPPFRQPPKSTNRGEKSALVLYRKPPVLAADAGIMGFDWRSEAPRLNW